MIPDNTWHQRDIAAAVRLLESNLETGLSDAEAAARRAQYGPNELTGTGIRSPWSVLWEQLTSLMVVILIVAAVVSALLGDFKDAIAIGAIVVLNAALGFSQEYRAEQAMAALKKLSVPMVRVRRGGQMREISSLELVPGDLIFLEAGNFIAADARVVESAGLTAAEAALTGESEPIHKTSEALPEEDLPLGDRHNMAYRGTFVTAGRGVALVTGTGMKTEIGHIATMLQGVGSDLTPLQRRLEHLGKGLAITALILVAVIFTLGLLRGEDLTLMLLTAVSIGVAAVPEGLPAVVTIALTFGAQRMLKRRVLIRKLPAVETLGSVTVICSDKTGTLTENKMTAAVLQLPDRKTDVGRQHEPAKDTDLALLLAGAALCNDVAVSNDGTMLGDPTELALASVAMLFGLDKRDLDRALPRVAEVPFDSGRKRMTTVHALSSPGSPPEPLRKALAGAGERAAFTKGAFDRLLPLSTRLWLGDHRVPLDDMWRARLAQANDDLAGNGMRVLAVAFRDVPGHEPIGESIENDLTFVGLIGIIDPPRAEVAEAVATCQAAGIRAVMITGDHPLTAGFIARQIGIANRANAAAALTGPGLDALSLEELEKAGESTAVYARVSPEHKLKIIEGLRRRGEIVAMTGDGVNDAPALKKADIGVAMGVTGTDVAKEAADMVLLDDNFATIVAAVEEGRVIYDNVRKFVKYILGTNSGEIWLMLAAPFLGMPIPLLPLQILWLNLVTDGLPALALGVEPPEQDVMRRPPYPPSESIFARGLGRHALWVGALMAVLCLAAGYTYWRAGDPAWQTILFTTLTFCQMAHVMAIRSEHSSLFQVGVFSNRPLVGAVSLTIILQLALIYVPWLQDFFRTVGLSANQLALTFGLSLIVFAAVELEKLLGRHRRK